MNDQQDKSGADSASSADKAFNEEVDRRLEQDKQRDGDTPADDAGKAFRQQRDKDDDSVLEEEEDEGNPADPNSEPG